VYNKYVEREVLSMADNKANKKKVRIGWHIGKVLLVALVIFSLLMNACVLYVLGAGEFGSAVIINGKDGKDGIDGVDGKDGKDGINGINGKDGVDGKNGKDGLNGRDGVDGVDGINGIDGKDGKDGVDGLTPYIGEDGIWYIGDTCTGAVANGTIVMEYSNLGLFNANNSTFKFEDGARYENIMFCLKDGQMWVYGSDKQIGPFEVVMPEGLHFGWTIYVGSFQLYDDPNDGTLALCLDIEDYVMLQAYVMTHLK
jgi:hypothetical protein